MTLRDNRDFDAFAGLRFGPKTWRNSAVRSQSLSDKDAFNGNKLFQSIWKWIPLLFVANGQNEGKFL